MKNLYKFEKCAKMVSVFWLCGCFVFNSPIGDTSESFIAFEVFQSSMADTFLLEELCNNRSN